MEAKNRLFDFYNIGLFVCTYPVHSSMDHAELAWVFVGHESTEPLSSLLRELRPSAPSPSSPACQPTRTLASCSDQRRGGQHGARNRPPACWRVRPWLYGFKRMLAARDHSSWTRTIVRVQPWLQNKARSKGSVILGHYCNRFIWARHDLRALRRPGPSLSKPYPPTRPKCPRGLRD